MKGVRILATDFYGNEFIVEEMIPLSPNSIIPGIFMLVSMNRKLHRTVTCHQIEKAIRDGERIDKYDNS